MSRAFAVFRIFAIVAAMSAAPSFAAPNDAKPPPPGLRIVAVVDGEPITNSDIDARARLFAMSIGIGVPPDAVERLKPQILRQLIDERLRIASARNHKIVVTDNDIARSVQELERRNNMPPGGLRQRLQASGTSIRTLYDQLRAQLAWNQVLRDLLGDRALVTEPEIDEQMRLRSVASSQQEYRIAEIFVPIDDPAHTADAERFAEIVIRELRAGAPFPIVAAQFSQSQSALTGGDRGWVRTNQLEPEVAKLVEQMPTGAVANPIKVAGGYVIVALIGKRSTGMEPTTVLNVRQLSLPFVEQLNPQAPTAQQRQAVERAHAIASRSRGCEQLEQNAKAANEANRVSDPGEIRLSGVNPPQFRQLLATIPIGQPTQPNVAMDGVTVIVVCSREQKSMPAASRQELQFQLVNERIDLLSRQLMRDIKRQANIDIRGRV